MTVFVLLERTIHCADADVRGAFHTLAGAMSASGVDQWTDLGPNHWMSDEQDDGRFWIVSKWEVRNA